MAVYFALSSGAWQPCPMADFSLSGSIYEQPDETDAESIDSHQRGLTEHCLQPFRSPQVPHSTRLRALLIVRSRAVGEPGLVGVRRERRKRQRLCQVPAHRATR